MFCAPATKPALSAPGRGDPVHRWPRWLKMLPGPVCTTGGVMPAKTRIVHYRRVLAGALGSLLAVVAPAPAAVAVAGSPGGPGAVPGTGQGSPTTTPIHHLVVIFQENVAFDHYFATYPHARNPPGEPRFVPSPATPSVNGLSGGLLTDNPNAVNPFRQDRSHAFQCTNHHHYNLQQQAMDGGLMDQFVQSLGPTDPGCSPSQVMSYFD